MAQTRLYVKFETLISGTTPLYLSTGSLTSEPSNTYYYLDVDGLSYTEQAISPLDGGNTFPSLSFTAKDPKKVSATDIGILSDLIYTHSAYLYNTIISFWEGDDATAAASFTKVFQGYLENYSRVPGGFSFEVGSIFKRLEQPIAFRTGSFQVQTALEINDRYCLCYKPVNLTAQSRTNFIDTTLANWTVSAGGFTETIGPKFNGTTTGLNTIYRDINQGSGATQVKFGAVYSFYFKYSGYAGGDGPNPITITVQGYNGASLVDTWSTIISRDHANTASYRSAGIMYPVQSSSITKVRVTITDDYTSIAGAPYIKDIRFAIANPWIIEREIVDIDTYDSSTGQIELSVRGGLGSYPSKHEVDAEAKALTIWAGHPLDLMRRAVTTTTAGTNGSYDVGDGYGLGTLFTSSLLSSNISTVRDATDSGSDFSGYNFGNYRMVFLHTEKIENTLEWIQKEICAPLFMNLFINGSGLLDIKGHIASESAGSGTLSDSTIIAEDEIPFTYDRAATVNKIIYRMDFDPTGGCDVQGNQSGGASGFLREWTFTEPSFGEDSTTAAAEDLYGSREITVESQGLRGAQSTRFGYLAAFGGDQTAYESARRVMTRYRHPIPEYEIEATYSKRAIAVGDIISVTSSHLLDMKSGQWGRTAHKFAVLSKEVDYSAARVRFRLQAVQDVAAIPNTTTAGAVSAPVDADITAVAKAASLVAEQRQDYPIYPKGWANVVQVTIATPFSDTDGSEILIYAYVSTATTGPGSDADYQLVGEVAAGTTSFYLCAIGQGSGNSYMWIKAKFRNADRVSSTFGPLEPGGTYATIAAGASHGTRGSKSEIRMLAGTQFGNRGGVTVQLGALSRS